MTTRNLYPEGFPMPPEVVVTCPKRGHFVIGSHQLAEAIAQGMTLNRQVTADQHRVAMEETAKAIADRNAKAAIDAAAAEAQAKAAKDAAAREEAEISAGVEAARKQRVAAEIKRRSDADAAAAQVAEDARRLAELNGGGNAPPAAAAPAAPATGHPRR